MQCVQYGLAEVRSQNLVSVRRPGKGARYLKCLIMRYLLFFVSSSQVAGSQL